MIKYLLALLLIPSVVCAGTISGGSGASGSIVSAAAATGVMSAGTPSTEQKMIAQWQFEDSLVDTTSITGVLTANGSPSYSYDYPIAGSSSIYLNGSNQYLSRDYADLSNYAPFKGASNDFTICGMFEGHSVDSIHYVFALFDADEDERKIGIGLNTNQVMFVVHGNATGTTNESAVHGSSYGLGVRVAFVYTESVSTGNYTLDIYNIDAGEYLGNQLSGTWSNTYNISDQPDLTIGTRPGSSLYLTGLVDEVRVYNKILNATEKAEYYAYATSSPSDPEYGAVFATGWEGVTLQPEANDYQYFVDDGLGACQNNTSYCTIGNSDSSTGYNVPADMPGRWRVTGTSKPGWNLLDQDYAEVSITDNPTYVHSGTWGLYTNGSYVNGAREHLNVWSTGSGEAYDDFTETMMRIKVKIFVSAFPENSFFLLQEWAAGNDPARIIIYRVTGAVYSSYHTGGVSCTGGTNPADWCYAYGPSLPLNEWFEMIVYHKFSDGGDGRIVWKYKKAGEAAVTLIDETHRTRYGGAIEFWNPIKRYDTKGKFNNMPIAWDDFTIFDPSLVNPTDGLPAWTIDD